MDLIELDILKLEESYSNLEKAMSKLSFDIEKEKLLYEIAIKSAIAQNKTRSSSKGEIHLFFFLENLELIFFGVFS